MSEFEPEKQSSRAVIANTWRYITVGSPEGYVYLPASPEADVLAVRIAEFADVVAAKAASRAIQERGIGLRTNPGRTAVEQVVEGPRQD